MKKNTDILCILKTYTMRNKVVGIPNNFRTYTIAGTRSRAAIVVTNNHIGVLLLKQHWRGSPPSCHWLWTMWRKAELFLWELGPWKNATFISVSLCACRLSPLGFPFCFFLPCPVSFISPFAGYLPQLDHSLPRPYPVLCTIFHTWRSSFNINMGSKRFLRYTVNHLSDYMVLHLGLLHSSRISTVRIWNLIIYTIKVRS